MANKSAALSGL